MAAPRERHTRRALSAARGRLQKAALKLVGWLAIGYLILRLLPVLKQALRSLECVSPAWIIGAIALETASEFGYVVAWRSIVDPENLLERDGRGARTGTRAAWAQLGAGIVVPGGALANVGVGAWILRRFGMPVRTIAERQFNLSFLNTAVDAVALVLGGGGGAAGVGGGEHEPLLTIVPAACAAAGIAVVVLLARGADTYSKRLEDAHAKLAGTIRLVADAVDATYRTIFRRAHRGSLLGAVAYLGFDNLVLWTAFCNPRAPRARASEHGGWPTSWARAAHRSPCRPVPEASPGSPGCWCSTAWPMTPPWPRCCSTK